MTTATAPPTDVQTHSPLGRVLGHCRDVALSASERWVLVAATAEADWDANVLPSVCELTALTGLGKSSVYRALGHLREVGLIRDDQNELGRIRRFQLDRDACSASRHGRYAEP